LNNFIDYEYDVELNNLEEILAFISESEQDFETLVSIFSRIPRVGITTAEQFVANAPLALTFIESINDIRKSKGITQSKSKSENITQNPMIKSKNFVITGKKEPLKSIIESNGGKVAANVSGTTDIAIYAGESKSEKVINKWEPLLLDERYKFRIMSEAEFRKEFNI
jgi:NAD-dependent DNA ligase